jgi:UDP-N-acetylglucosamine transferase subunit ALG13
MIRFIKEISKLNYFTTVLVCQSTSGLKINMNRIAALHKPNILIAPLDWGLGHTTRCIPIIHMLIQNNCNVFVACNGQINALLHNEFPQIHYVDLKGYDIQYSKNSWTFPIKIGKQIPKILSTIQYENERLKEIVKEHNVHGIISDNRYGFYHKSIPSVFITHQLRIQTPFGKIGDDFLQKINYKYINKFWQCWVPDNENDLNFAGKLSHPATKPAAPVKYIGILSRFKSYPVSPSHHLLILLSGPEPQRTLFEHTIITELNSYRGKVVLVRGLPNESKKLVLGANVGVHNHLSSIELNQKIREAWIVVARCGYSTVMDLAVLKKKSILVATPGQTEQEYLAKHLMKKNFALCIDQKKFRLKNALELSGNFNYQFQDFSSENCLKGAVDEFIAHLRID